MIKVMCSSNRLRRWSQKSHLVRQVLFQISHNLIALADYKVFILVRKRDSYRIEIGRVGQLVANPHLIGIKTFVILLLGKPNGIMARIIGLNNNLSFLVRPTGTTSHLSQELEGTLSRTKIR